MKNKFGIEYLVNNNKAYSRYVLAADVGGTNTTIGVCGICGQIPSLVFYKRYKSQNINSIVPPLREILEYTKNNHNIDLQVACFGCAGVQLKKDIVKLTNLKWGIDLNEVIQKTEISKAFIINDFQAIGYGINFLKDEDSKDIFIVRSTKHDQNKAKTKVIIGAGTGLGKAILAHDNYNEVYTPLPSEGGHTDFPIHNEFEFRLVRYIKEKKNLKSSVRYEDILSGTGIELIYLFLKASGEYSKTHYDKIIEKSKDKASLISKYKDIDEKSKEAFRLFTRFYGRCAKNFALDTLSLGGLYIAGGIASKNKEIFKTEDFLKEFEKCSAQKKVLESIPIYVILNYDVSLYGAAYYAMINSI